MKKVIKVVCSSLILSTATIGINAIAWHDTGHMVVAGIAYQNLDKAIVNDIDGLIAKGALEYPKNNTFITASVWADDIKGHGIDFFDNWHFHDRYVALDNTPLPAYNPGKATKMLATNLKLLTSERTTESEKAFALKMIIHLVGDMHQPLHNISRISKAYPRGDQGGNLFKLKGKVKNLHSLWDSALTSLPRFDRPFKQDQEIKFSRLINKITGEYPVTAFSPESIAVDYAVWQTEGYDISLTYAYQGISPNTEPNEAYIHDNAQIAQARIALAGYRLANILNCAWGSDLCLQSS